MRLRLERFGRVPPMRAFVEELRLAEERDARGEPAHLGEMLLRLTRAAIVRNTVVEERVADETDESIEELRRLDADVRALIRTHVRSRRDRVASRARSASGSPRHGSLPALARACRGSPSAAPSREVSLDPESRDQTPWTVPCKQSLIDRGFMLTDAELADAGVDVDRRAASA